MLKSVNVKFFGPIDKDVKELYEGLLTLGKAPDPEHVQQLIDRSQMRKTSNKLVFINSRRRPSLASSYDLVSSSRSTGSLIGVVRKRSPSDAAKIPILMARSSEPRLFGVDASSSSAAACSSDDGNERRFAASSSSAPILDDSFDSDDENSSSSSGMSSDPDSSSDSDSDSSVFESTSDKRDDIVKNIQLHSPTLPATPAEVKLKRSMAKQQGLLQLAINPQTSSFCHTYYDMDVFPSHMITSLGALFFKQDQEIPADTRHTMKYITATSYVTYYFDDFGILFARPVVIPTFTLATVDLNCYRWYGMSYPSAPGDAEQVMHQKKLVAQRYIDALARHYQLILFAASEKYNITDMIIPLYICADMLPEAEQDKLPLYQVQAMLTALKNHQGSVARIILPTYRHIFRSIIRNFEHEMRLSDFKEIQFILTLMPPVTAASRLQSYGVTCGYAMPLSNDIPFKGIHDEAVLVPDAYWGAVSTAAKDLTIENPSFANPRYSKPVNFRHQVIITDYELQVGLRKNMISLMLNNINTTLKAATNIEATGVELDPEGNLIVRFAKASDVEEALGTADFTSSRKKLLPDGWFFKGHSSERELMFRASVDDEKDQVYSFVKKKLSQDTEKVRIFFEQMLGNILADGGEAKKVQVVADRTISTNNVNGIAFLINGVFTPYLKLQRFLGGAKAAKLIKHFKRCIKEIHGNYDYSQQDIYEDPERELTAQERRTKHMAVGIV
jgi:hypothetical protein